MLTLLCYISIFYQVTCVTIVGVIAHVHVQGTESCISSMIELNVFNVVDNLVRSYVYQFICHFF